MNRLLLFLCLCASALGATGDLSAPTVGTNGWDAFITIAGISTNGTYNFKLKSVNGQSYPTANTPYFTVTSMGYDDTGTPITFSRKVYATAKVRMPYPNGQYADESLSGGNVTVHFSLHSPIYTKESTNLVFTDPQGGFYNLAGATNNPTTSLATTDNSTLTYPRVRANFTRVPNQRFTNTATGYVFGANNYAVQGRPLRVVKFWATDAHSHTATSVFVTKPTFDTTSTDIKKHAIEYVGAVDISGFTALDQCQLHFQAYPWMGDTFLDTSDGAFTPPSPNYTYQNFLCDNAGTYGAVYAVVDPANGSASGVVGTNTFNPSSPPTPFLTIAAAFTAMALTNNTMYGHNDCGGGTVYLTNASVAWMGASGSYGGTPKTFATLRNYPGVPTASCILSSQSGNAHGPNLIKLEGVTVTAGSGTGVFSTMTCVWSDQCVLNSPTTSPCYYNNSSHFFTGNTVKALKGGITPFSTGNYPMNIVRGNDLSGMTGSVIGYVVISNYKDNTGDVDSSAFSIATWVAGSSAPYPSPLICAFNEIYGISSTKGEQLGIGGGVYGCTNNFVVCQNLIESTNAGSPIVAFYRDGTTNAVEDNFIEWNNVDTGERHNHMYCDTSTAFSRTLNGWSVINNISDCANIKADCYGTPDGNRTYNFTGKWGCGWSGNVWAQTTILADFLNEFPGLQCYQPTITTSANVEAGGHTNVTGWVNYVNRASYAGSSGSGINGSGGGKYRLQSSSPAVLVPTAEVELPERWVLPFDLEGNYRGMMDPPGVYAAGQPRKGGGFFAP